MCNTSSFEWYMYLITADRKYILKVMSLTCSLSPVEETKEDVPTITVDNAEAKEEGGKEEEESLRKRKESKAQQKKVPDHGIQMTGWVHRKIGWNRWEKCWCVLTFNALYFTGGESSGDYNHTLQLGDSNNAVQQKKGHNKQSKSLLIKTGKKSEQMSIESVSECDQWQAALEVVMGISGVEELASEDEETGELIEEGVCVCVCVVCLLQ